MVCIAYRICHRDNKEKFSTHKNNTLLVLITEHVLSNSLFKGMLLILVYVSSGIRTMWPNRERRHACIIAKGCGCLDTSYCVDEDYPARLCFVPVVVCFSDEVIDTVDR